MTSFLKDILQLIFLEIEFGKDMINFSEISRRCHQIFQQIIKVERGHNEIYMVNTQGQLHGLMREWDELDHLKMSLNWFRNEKHGYSYRQLFLGWYYNDYYRHGYKLKNK